MSGVQSADESEIRMCLGNVVGGVEYKIGLWGERMFGVCRVIRADL